MKTRDYSDATALSFALLALEGVGQATANRITHHFEDLDSLRNMPVDQVRARLKGVRGLQSVLAVLRDEDLMASKLEAARQELDLYAARGILCYSARDHAWPVAINRLAVAERPTLLYAYGDESLIGGPCAAFVANPPLDHEAFELAQQLAEALLKKGIPPLTSISNGFDVVVSRLSESSETPLVMIAETGLARIATEYRAAASAVVKKGGLLLSPFPMQHGPFNHDARTSQLVKTTLARVSIAVASREADDHASTTESIRDTSRAFSVPGAAEMPFHSIRSESDFDWVFMAANQDFES